MVAIDIHNHCNCGLKDDCPETDFHKRNKDFLLGGYEYCNILAGAFSYYPAVLASNEIFESNSLLFEDSQKEKKLFQWAVLDPRQERLFPQVEQLLQTPKVLGIKIHSVCHKYDIFQYGDSIFSFADSLGAFVVMHPDQTDQMLYFADRYPNMKLIIAHLDGEDHINAIKKAKHQNVYADTSGMASFQNNVVERAVAEIGSEKIFFGTDSYAYGFQKGRIEYARISDEDKENILFKNAKRCFEKQFKDINI